MNRNKVISIRINEERYNKFLEIVNKFTYIFEIDYPSRTEKRYHTKFPDKQYSFDKYTLADLVNEALKEFIEKYKSYV